MTAVECVEAARRAGAQFQAPINLFVDAFRRASQAERERMIAAPITPIGRIEGLVAAVVSSLCRETNTEPPPGSPKPRASSHSSHFQRLPTLCESG